MACHTFTRFVYAMDYYHPNGLLRSFKRNNCYYALIQDPYAHYCRYWLKNIFTCWRTDCYYDVEGPDDEPSKVSIITGCEYMYWYKNRNFHRDHGPAAICKGPHHSFYHEGGFHDYRETWYQHGHIHNVNGPSGIYYRDGKVVGVTFYLRDKRIL